MARAETSDVLRPSILDRLIDDSGASSFQGVTVRELKASVARDVEWLLNTTHSCPYDLSRYPEAQASMITYGLPDLSSFSWGDSASGDRIAALIEERIKRFEPRIQERSVRCAVQRADDVADFRLRVRIEAILHVEPILEPVVFDSGLDLAGGSFRIESFE